MSPTRYASTCALSWSSDAVGAARSTAYLPAASIESKIDRRRVMDHVAVIVQIMGDFLRRAKIGKPDIRKLEQSRGGISGEIIHDLQRRRRSVAHRHELQDRIGRKVDVEF